MFLNEACTLENDLVGFFVALIAHRFEDCHELLHSAEVVFKSFSGGLPYSLVFTLLQQTVDDILRTSAFVVIIYLLPVWSYTTGNDMDMIVVSIMMGIDKHGLAWLAIAHLTHISTGKTN